MSNVRICRNIHYLQISEFYLFPICCGIEVAKAKHAFEVGDVVVIRDGTAHISHDLSTESRFIDIFRNRCTFYLFQCTVRRHFSDLTSNFFHHQYQFTLVLKLYRKLAVIAVYLSNYYSLNERIPYLHANNVQPSLVRLTTNTPFPILDLNNLREYSTLAPGHSRDPRLGPFPHQAVSCSSSYLLRTHQPLAVQETRRTASDYFKDCFREKRHLSRDLVEAH